MELQTGNANILVMKKMAGLYNTDTGQPKPKLVNECALDRMEVKEKIHTMQPADWLRFKDRWKLWKGDQPLGQNLSIHLLDLFPNPRKEITSKLPTTYNEQISWRC